MSALLFACMVSFSGKSAASDSLRGFLDSHCVKCHGPEKQKGKLRLDTLAPPPRERERWLAVMEALESGDMPPKEEARPESRAKGRVLDGIADALADSEDGNRLALRRMNRNEYEHTVHDLLGIGAPLAELLPEDASVQGFDNVGHGLSISSVLVERYLEAANAAFDAAILRIPPLPAETRRSAMMENKENIDSVKKSKGGTIAVKEAFVKFTPGWPPARMDSAHPIEDGVYRCRLAVWPHQPGERTLALAVYTGPLFGSGKREFMGMFDVTGTPEKPRVIEFTTRLKENHTMHLVPWVFPRHITYRDKDEPRPGIGIVWAETHGPLDQEFPSMAQRRLFGNAESIAMESGTPIWMRHRKGVKLHHVVSSRPREDTERIVRAFAARAFRRPVAEEEVDPFVQLALGRLDEGRTFEQAVRAGICAVLCAPQFLVLNREPAVDDFTLASRLSYFLWSSMPDDTLLRLAEEGRLGDRETRHAQVERMLRDPRAGRFVKHFTGQWLDLRDISFTTPDKKLYPEFDDLLKESMLREARGFFRHILERDLSVRNFIDSDFAILNERLAKHYGIDGVKGHEAFRVVKLPEDSIRGGVLTQGAVLKVTANGTNSSPVLRGVWVLENLLGQRTPPPPAGVPAVEPDIRGAASIREQLAKHTSDPSCARCHDRIDPPGFALECFDPIGGFRDRYRSLGKGDRPPGKKVSYRIGKAVEQGGTLRDGREFAGFREFRQHLLEDPDPVARAIATKLLVYATGRPVTAADRKAVDAVVESARTNDLGLRSMIHAVVDNPLFHQP